MLEQLLGRLAKVTWWKLLISFVVIAILYNVLSVNVIKYFLDEEV
ncbi:hypothetical protein [Pontibacter rugosus]|uniref:Uncharacterized protein n=1 Tax=Pontibacter rugosus TaxID=1745966 RepID=A0ABW3SLS5_9BACT